MSKPLYGRYLNAKDRLNNKEVKSSLDQYFNSNGILIPKHYKEVCGLCGTHLHSKPTTVWFNETFHKSCVEARHP